MSKRRSVVYTGVKGEAKNAEVTVPGLPVFKRGVPQFLPEVTAKQLVESAGDRFSYAKAKKAVKAKTKKAVKDKEK